MYNTYVVLLRKRISYINRDCLVSDNNYRSTAAYCSIIDEFIMRPIIQVTHKTNFRMISVIIFRQEFCDNDLTIVGANRVKLIWVLGPYIFRRSIRVYTSFLLIN